MWGTETLNMSCSIVHTCFVKIQSLESLYSCLIGCRACLTRMLYMFIYLISSPLLTIFPQFPNPTDTASNQTTQALHCQL
jgi:hypothetical protein